MTPEPTASGGRLARSASPPSCCCSTSPWSTRRCRRSSSDLGGSFTDLQWVIDAYALSLAALVLTAGSLADRLGRRRVFAIGLAIFSVASLLCALAPDPTSLNVARGLQGIGGAIMFAVSLALVAQEFPSGPERGMAMGIYGATIGIAVAIGPLLGGLLTDGFGWESVFLINVPIGLAAIAVTYWKLAESRDPNATRIDWGGPPHLLDRAVRAGAGAGPRQRRGLGQRPDRLPLRRRSGADGRLRRDRATGEGADAAALAVPPPRLQRRAAGGVRGLGLDVRPVPLPDALPAELPRLLAVEAGLRYLPITVASFIVAPLSGMALAKVQARYLMSAGLALTGVGLLLMGGLDLHSEWTALLAGFIISGIGVGLLNPVDRRRRPQRRPQGAQRHGSGDQRHLPPGRDRRRDRRLGGDLPRCRRLEDAGGRRRRGQQRRSAEPGRSDLLGGAAAGALRRCPRGRAELTRNAAEQGFLHGLNEILLLGALLSFAGAAFALWLVRESEIERETLVGTDFEVEPEPEPAQALAMTAPGTPR